MSSSSRPPSGSIASPSFSVATPYFAEAFNYLGAKCATIHGRRFRWRVRFDLQRGLPRAIPSSNSDFYRVRTVHSHWRTRNESRTYRRCAHFALSRRVFDAQLKMSPEITWEAYLPDWLPRETSWDVQRINDAGDNIVVKAYNGTLDDCNVRITEPSRCS